MKNLLLVCQKNIYCLGFQRNFVISMFLAFALVPFLKDILGRLLPMLMLTKQDNMRWVFAHCEFVFIVKKLRIT